MNRDLRLVARRRKLIGLFMRKQQRLRNYDYQTAIAEAAQIFSVKKRTAIKDFTEYNKTYPMASTHLQLQLPL